MGRLKLQFKPRRGSLSDIQAWSAFFCSWWDRLIQDVHLLNNRGNSAKWGINSPTNSNLLKTMTKIGLVLAWSLKQCSWKSSGRCVPFRHFLKSFYMIFCWKISITSRKIPSTIWMSNLNVWEPFLISRQRSTYEPLDQEDPKWWSLYWPWNTTFCIILAWMIFSCCTSLSYWDPLFWPHSHFHILSAIETIWMPKIWRTSSRRVLTSIFCCQNFWNIQLN